MLAQLRLAPTGDSLDAVLDQILDALVHVNLTWIHAVKARGLTPPCCTACAAPPWVTRPVRYVPHHGRPVDSRRWYLDGPTMFARGVGTCADIAAYDAAAAIADGKSARVLLRGGPVTFHAVIEVDGEITDPSVEIANRDTSGEALAALAGVLPCGCAGGAK